METNNPESQHNPGPEHTPKPPPIYIQDVTSIPPLLQLLEQVAAQQYETKALADNQVKFNLKLLIPIGLSPKPLQKNKRNSTHTSQKKNTPTEQCSRTCIIPQPLPISRSK
jgi:hypothetical protein